MTAFLLDHTAASSPANERPLAGTCRIRDHASREGGPSCLFGRDRRRQREAPSEAIEAIEVIEAIEALSTSFCFFPPSSLVALCAFAAPPSPLSPSACIAYPGPSHCDALRKGCIRWAPIPSWSKRSPSSSLSLVSSGLALGGCFVPRLVPRLVPFVSFLFFFRPPDPPCRSIAPATCSPQPAALLFCGSAFSGAAHGQPSKETLGPASQAKPTRTRRGCIETRAALPASILKNGRNGTSSVFFPGKIFPPHRLCIVEHPSRHLQFGVNTSLYRAA